MNSLDIFLRALETVLGFKKKKQFFVPLISTTSNIKFPAIKTIKVEVHCIDGAYDKIISTSTDSFNSCECSSNDMKCKVIQKTIENILKFYGI